MTTKPLSALATMRARLAEIQAAQTELVGENGYVPNWGRYRYYALSEEARRYKDAIDLMGKLGITE